MSCNDLRLIANQALHDIWDGVFDIEEKKSQLEIIAAYTKACLEDLAKREKTDGKA